MGLKADWFTSSSVDTEDYDPFESNSSGMSIMAPISIESSEAELHEELRALLKREAHLFDMKITCAVKDRSDTSCSACPICEAEDPDSMLGLLCKVGRAQERTLTTMFAKRQQSEVRAPSAVAA